MNLNSKKEKKSFKELLIEIYRFLISKFFLKNFGLSIVVLIMFFFITKWFLGAYTDHGEYCTVPNFKGMSIPEVSELADKKNLRFEIIDCVYNAPVRKGTVVEQTPRPDSKVKEERKIFLTIKTYNPERIKIPNFTGVSLIQAKADIESYGLKIGKISYEPDIATNAVLKQKYNGREIEKGTLIEKGSKIDLVLGMGDDDERTTIPNLIGLTFDESKKKATELFVNIGTIIFDETIASSQDSINAVVWKQSPPKNRTVKMGTEINIWLTMDKSILSD